MQIGRRLIRLESRTIMCRLFDFLCVCHNELSHIWMTSDDGDQSSLLGRDIGLFSFLLSIMQGWQSPIYHSIQSLVFVGN